MRRRTPMEIDVDLSRERILDVAEEHFRRIGYQKTRWPTLHPASE